MKRIFTHYSLGSNGRLGNQLFQIAATIGISKDHHAGVIFPREESEWKYQPYFQNQLEKDNYVAGRYFNRRIYTEPFFHYAQIRPHATFIQEGYGCADGDIIDLKGYFQSEKYWENHRENIYKQFEFEKSFREKWEQTMKGIKASLPGREICSIHMRFGDYVGNPFYADLKRDGYYKRAIQYALKEWKTERPPLFLLFSDDRTAAAEYLDRIKQDTGNFEYLIITTSTSDISDLCLMSLCSGHIIANSSFSWWGAYLSKSNKVIAPKKWFGDIAGFDTKDLYLPHMIRL